LVPPFFKEVASTTAPFFLGSPGPV
jgi:hypothetical protein